MYLIFDKEFDTLIDTIKSPSIDLIKIEFNESKATSYYAFLDDFLFKYGLISSNCQPTLKKNKYLPYVSYSSSNIFNENKGLKYLVRNPVSFNDAQKLLSKYIFEKLTVIDITRHSIKN